MEFTRKTPYIKQIALYLQNNEPERAYALAQDFAHKFSGELVAHFLMAKTAFRLKKFPDATVAARRAFNLATTKQDMLTCAVVLSAAYYMQGNTPEAYAVLGKVGGTTENADVARLMFVYASTVKNPSEAVRHLDRLYELNPRMAEAFIQKFF